MWKTWRLSMVLPAAFLVSAGPASADWLVTRDGARMETRGTWKVRGGTVVFKAMNGTLSSMSVGDVDLDRSAALTAEKKAPPPVEATAAPKKAVLSIGQDDIPRALSSGWGARQGEASSTLSADGEAGGGDPRSAAAFAEQLEVTHWEKSEPSWLDGVEIVGQIDNRSRSTAMELSLTVKIFDQDGRPLAARRAFLESRALIRGGTLDFRVPFEGVADFETVEFEVSATEVELGVGAIDAFDATPAADEAATGESGS